MNRRLFFGLFPTVAVASSVSLAAQPDDFLTFGARITARAQELEGRVTATSDATHLLFRWDIVHPETEEVLDSFSLSIVEIKKKIDAVEDPAKKALLVQAFASIEGQEALAASMTPQEMRAA